VPTVFTHAVAGLVLGRCLAPARWTPGFAALCAVSAALPDSDAVFQSLWDAGALDPFEHRGLTHSLFFAAAWGALAAFVLWRRDRAAGGADFLRRAGVLALVTASHGLLDAMTDGGSPIALFAPLSEEGWFSPWRPIPVAPISARAFFGPWGLRVLGAEVLWVWLPLLVLLAVVEIVRRRRLHRSQR
jgi:inner membrane protein